MKITIIIEDEKKCEVKVLKAEQTEIKSERIGSQYARFFDGDNPNWHKSIEYNLMFLRSKERYANDLLKARGYLFLNEVYQMLGLSMTKDGQVVGWVYNEKNPIGDNFVDFGIKIEHEATSIKGFENSILLDFNVDGSILEYI